MLSGIIRQAVADEPSLRIVDELAELDQLPDVVSRLRPDVLIVGADGGELPVECARSMYTPPHPRTLAISADGRITSAYWLRPQGVRMENVTPAGIVEAIEELSASPLEESD